MSLKSAISIPGLSNGQHVVRTTTRQQNPLIFTDSQDRNFVTEFLRPTSSKGYMAKQVFPGKKSGTTEELSWWIPPPHYHLLQDEHFKVESGEGVWHLWGGKTVHLKKGDEIIIPARKWHTFQKTEGSEEPFSVLYQYDKEYAEMEESFFRNCFTYFEDCRKGGAEPSIFQLGVFAVHFWMPIALPVPGPEWFNFVVSTVMTVLLGCIGQYVLGYKASYVEYYAKDAKKQE